MYSSTDAAKKLNISAKDLRVIVRKSPQFKNAGVGGRYMFTEENLVLLAFLIDAAKKNRRQYVTLEADRPGITVEFMKRAQRDPMARRQQLQLRADRQRRLAEKLAATR